MEPNPRSALLGRLITAAAILCAVVVVGASVYRFLGAGRWSWSDCIYMTVITLSTVGYGEVLSDMDQVPYARLWTIVQIVLGSGTLLYFVSTFTAFLIETDIQGAIRRNRMLKKINDLCDHIVVAGLGATGIHVVMELLATKTPFVVIERDEQRLARVVEELESEFLYVTGDATDDRVLEQAGIKVARALSATLADDRDNVYVCIAARSLNPNLRIVATATEATADDKLKRAGADAAVSPSFIGGMRIASELLRPNVVEFLDQMLRGRDPALRIEEIPIPEGSSLIGAPLKKTRISRYNVLVLAVRGPDGKFSYNPGPDFILSTGTTLVVLTKTDDVINLRRDIQSGSI